MSYPTRRIAGWTWVGWLNLLLLQWLGARLAGRFEGGRDCASEAWIGWGVYWPVLPISGFIGRMIGGRMWSRHVNIDNIPTASRAHLRWALAQLHHVRSVTVDDCMTDPTLGPAHAVAYIRLRWYACLAWWLRSHIANEARRRADEIRPTGVFIEIRISI